MTVYHSGERRVQERAGVPGEAGAVAGMIKSAVPPVAAAFLAAQPLLVVGAADPAGRLWATMLTGTPGFVTATGDSAVHIAAAPLPGDPLHGALVAGPARVGTLALEPARHRRMRMNGTARPAPDGGLDLTLDQVFANCPKYIQKRECAPPAADAPGPGAPRHGSRLTALQREFVTATDTFFVATADPAGNADASHRGGPPGFLRPVSATRLRWPDYAGNAMFCTLGNIESQPRTGLLLMDWERGTALHLTGTARVDWDPEHAGAVPGAERMVEFDIERVVEIPHASPLTWGAPQYSRFNPRAA